MTSPPPPPRRPAASPFALDTGTLGRLAALCEASPDRESCGFLVRRRAGLEVVPVPNAADRYHEADPGAHPRTSRDAFLMDPRAQLRVYRSLRDGAGEIVAVWHSHVDAGARLSSKDRADAVVDGLPQVPGAEYVVLGMRDGGVTETRRYRLAGGAFVEVEVEGGGELPAARTAPARGETR